MLLTPILDIHAEEFWFGKMTPFGLGKNLRVISGFLAKLARILSVEVVNKLQIFIVSNRGTFNFCQRGHAGWFSTFHLIPFLVVISRVVASRIQQMMAVQLHIFCKILGNLPSSISSPLFLDIGQLVGVLCVCLDLRKKGATLMTQY